MSMLHVTVHAACPFPCCMPMSILNSHVHICGLHARVHAASLCPCRTIISILHVRVHAVCPCPCCMFKSMQHGIDIYQGHGNAAWTWACSMDMGMQHGRRHLAWTEACSMDMDTWREDGQVLGHPLIFVSSPI
jgi:hypothetical protein